METLSERCQTCLTVGRRLISTSKIISLLKELKFRKLKHIDSICWECHRIVIKFYYFIRQVAEAQKQLCKKETHQKAFSKLSHTTKTVYDYEIIYNNDPLTHIDVDGKVSPQMVKQELESSDICHSDSDEKLQVFADKIKKAKKKKQSAGSKKIVKEDQSLELKEKFETVLYTEEEMLRSREEKRNQPNYKKIPYKCDNCVLGFTKKEYFDMHLKKKHDESSGEYICQVCSTRFLTKSALIKHNTKHYLHYKCMLCDYKTFAMKAALNHSRYKHEKDTKECIHCKLCDDVFRTPEELSEHNQKHILYCNECGEKFKGKHTLRSHLVRIHTVKREFVCDICKKTFLTKSRLESHVIKHSQTLARKLAYCAICCVQYKDIHVYRNHIRNSVNHAQNRYPCPVCNKKFASKVYWTKHYNFYHLKKSQYKCESCNKLFISDWRLKTHKQKHHGLSRSRDHACNTCHKKFYTSSTLRAHTLTHSDRRQYMCEGCGDTFKQRPALYTHTRLVHKT